MDALTQAFAIVPLLGFLVGCGASHLQPIVDRASHFSVLTPTPIAHSVCGTPVRCANDAHAAHDRGMYAKAAEDWQRASWDSCVQRTGECDASLKLAAQLAPIDAMMAFRMEDAINICEELLKYSTATAIASSCFLPLSSEAPAVGWQVVERMDSEGSRDEMILRYTSMLATRGWPPAIRRLHGIADLDASSAVRFHAHYVLFKLEKSAVPIEAQQHAVTAAQLVDQLSISTNWPKGIDWKTEVLTLGFVAADARLTSDVSELTWVIRSLPKPRDQTQALALLKRATPQFEAIRSARRTIGDVWHAGGLWRRLAALRMLEANAAISSLLMDPLINDACLPRTFVGDTDCLHALGLLSRDFSNEDARLGVDLREDASMPLRAIDDCPLRFLAGPWMSRARGRAYEEWRYGTVANIEMSGW